jgi:hypothetical protein
MENAGRLSFCGIRAIATIDVMEYQELLSSSDKLDELQKAEYLAGCKVQFLGLYFLCSYEEIKNYKKIPKYYKYFLKNTLKKGFMYGAWTFILDVVYISEEDRADLDELVTPKVEFFSLWSFDETEYVYFKTNYYQYKFINYICGDDMYTMNSTCKGLWYYWMVDMSVVVFYSLFLVETSTHWRFLRTWTARTEAIARLVAGDDTWTTPAGYE